MPRVIPDPADIKRIHLLGICGTGMGAFAGLLQQAGYAVTGSDKGVYPPMSDQLAALGISVYEGYLPENLEKANPDLVIVGNVCRRDNPEATAVRERDLPYTSFPEALGALFLSQAHPVVVAGTHGKTTTSSVLAHCLVEAGRDPGFLVGGVLKNFSGSYRVGAPGAPFVIEGDEYDTAYFDKVPKFTHYRPRTAVLTSVEFDHVDIYDGLDQVKEEFRGFVELVGRDSHGLLLACSDGEHVRDVAQTSQAPVVWYGCDEEARLSGKILGADAHGMDFEVRDGERTIGSFRCSLVGRHNLANLVAVVGVLRHLDVPVEAIRAALDSYEGVKRRQELIAEVGGVAILDDFAHHPTAVGMTIDAVRLRFPGRKIIAVFEPRSATSSRAVFQDAYPEAFARADEVLIAEVGRRSIHAEERMSSTKLADDTNALGTPSFFLPEVEDIVAHLTSSAHPRQRAPLTPSAGGGGEGKGGGGGGAGEPAAKPPAAQEV